DHIRMAGAGGVHYFMSKNSLKHAGQREIFVCYRIVPSKCHVWLSTSGSTSILICRRNCGFSGALSCLCVADIKCGYAVVVISCPFPRIKLSDRSTLDETLLKRIALPCTA